MTATDGDNGGADNRWLSWLRTGRDAGNAEARRRVVEALGEIYDRVLDDACITPGVTVLEVGAGEGMLGLRALELIGAEGRLVLSDISPAVIAALRHSLTGEARARIDLVTAPAETLEGIPDASVDVVMTRSVLIYSPDRFAALTAMARVLRPGGRVSMFEPLWQFFDPTATPTEFFGRDLGGHQAEIAAVMAGYQADLRSQLADPLTARSLIDAAEAAGLNRIRATVEAESKPLPSGDDVAVAQALHGRPNPNTRSPAEMAAAALTPSRAASFLAAVESSVRAGHGRTRTAAVYFCADR